MKRNVEQPDKQELTGSEAAKLLGISYATFMRRVGQGRISPCSAVNPALDKQRGLLFRRADVEALLKQ